MALIPCPECGNEVSDKAPTCPRCGAPIFRESKVVVHGYTQPFALNPAVKIFWDGEPAGSVKPGGRFELNIEHAGTISFRCNMRKAEVKVVAGRVTNIKLSWNRLTGKLVPEVVDVVTPGSVA